MIRTNHRNRATLGAVLLAAALCLVALPSSAGELAAVSRSANAVDFSLQMEAGAVTLTVSGPAGFAFQHRFAADENPSFSLFDEQGYPLADGTYSFELRATPPRAELRNRLDEAQRAGAASAAGDDRYVQSGFFTVKNGRIVSDVGEEPQAAAGTAGPHLDTRAQVFTQDVIVQDSLCVGVDCTSSENFGFDTIRLKENNLRIKFQDTSVGSFPTEDWQLTANDSSNGGASRFSIDDIDSGKTPFTIAAGAKSNSIYVDSSGRLGLKTSTPVVDIHTVSGNTPTLRLEQDSSSGFTAQTWDVAGNETVFFVRDVTNGSKLPFKVLPNAPTNSVVIGSSGNVGINAGTSPSQELHIKGSDNPKVLIEDSTDNANDKPGFILRSPAAANGGDWTVETDNAGNFQIDFGPSTNPELVISDNVGSNGAVTINGNLTVGGTFSNPSSRSLKEGFTPVDPEEILQKFASLPITEWTYKADPDKRHHVGPVVEDFQEAFGLGTQGKYIFPIDVQGITMVALQGLKLENDALKAENSDIKAENAQIKAENAQIKARLDRIESQLSAQAPAQ